MSEFNTNNLYEINKELVKEHDKPLKKYEIKDKIRKYIVPFFRDNDNQYFMLLCREQYDFTLFNFINGKTDDALSHSLQDCYECFTNRGQVTTIFPTETNDAIEIWIIIDNEAFAYYLFPYDIGVIEVEK